METKFYKKMSCPASGKTYEVITIGELFCGAGIGAVGSHNLKLETIYAYDNMKYAVETYNHNFGNIAEIVDLKTKDISEIPYTDIIMAGFPCFVAGTKVMTEKGYRNIEEVCIGDKVLTHKGRWMPVNAFMKEVKDTITIYAQGFKPTTTTEEHPFYCISKNKGSISEPYWKKAGELVEGDYLGLAINNLANNSLNLTKEECWILGRYVADGHLDIKKRKDRINSYNAKIILSVGSHKLGDVYSNITAQHITVHQHTKSVHRVIMTSQRLCDIIKDHGFGNKAFNKTIPSFILDLPKDLLKIFLNGYVSGDGHVEQDIVRCTTISEDLCLSLCIAAYKVYGGNASYSYTERPKTTIIEGRTVNQKDTYRTSFTRMLKRIGFVSNGILWRKFKKKEVCPVKVPVYNLGVAEDNTYTANNFIVHNCQPFSFNGKGLGENDPDKGNLGKITYDIIKHKQPKAFFLENVKGLSSKKNIPFLLELVDNFSEDYNVTWDVKNCADYGVPQQRERVFIIGIRKNFKKMFTFPKETHKDSHVTIRDTISDIKVKGDYIPNHTKDCGIRNDEAPYIRYLTDGQCWKHLPCEEMKKSFMKKAYYSGGGKTGYLGVIDKDKPARTILSSPKGKNSAQIIKWEGQPHRRYTVRESLRLQSVPDWWEFPEHIPLMKQYERCSGIPPLVSEMILKEMVDIIHS